MALKRLNLGFHDKKETGIFNKTFSNSFLKNVTLKKYVATHLKLKHNF